AVGRDHDRVHGGVDQQRPCILESIAASGTNALRADPQTSRAAGAGTHVALSQQIRNLLHERCILILREKDRAWNAAVPWHQLPEHLSVALGGGRAAKLRLCIDLADSSADLPPRACNIGH